MPFVVPTMPLVCRVWHNWDPLISVYTGDDLKSDCNLSPGKRVMSSVNFQNNNTPFYFFPMELLLPPLTDVRAATGNSGYDLIECPNGSTRFYGVSYVDDIGKGFANEHRLAIVFMLNIDAIFADGILPFPVPLP